MPSSCSGAQGTPLLLIHGFGASAYHWRYNINELAKTHRVFAIDLLGFGWSDKPLVEYSRYDLWPRQVSTFINEVPHHAYEIVRCCPRACHAPAHSSCKHGRLQ